MAYHARTLKGPDNGFFGTYHVDPAICHGKPCIRGLRYPVESVLEMLAGGMQTHEILADYEDLEHDDVLACLDFTARLSHVSNLDRLVA
jgi:uncharacterized protein (DUF433 family)